MCLTIGVQFIIAIVFCILLLLQFNKYLVELACSNNRSKLTELFNEPVSVVSGAEESLTQVI